MSTEIQWTDETWNPVTGCTKVSPGCAHCYAEGVANRFFGKQYPPVAVMARTGGGQVTRPREFTDVMTHADRLDQPLRWKKPRKVFVNSMSDLFHEDVPSEFIARTFGVMALAGRHTFQVLTKRAETMRRLLNDPYFRDEVDVAIYELGGDNDARTFPWPLPNVWLGVSVENQHFADERIPLLLQTPAAVRFISAEPLLQSIDMFAFLRGELRDECVGILNHSDSRWPKIEPGLDWVIVGGESGPGARPFDIEWARDIIAQSRSAKVPVFMKQLGRDPRGFCSWPHHAEKPPAILDRDGVLSSISGEPGTLCHAVDDAYWPCSPELKDRKGGDMAEWPADLRVREFPR